jgi:hypothetical protein
LRLGVAKRPVGTLADLKNNITVEKTGNSVFLPLDVNDTVSLSNTGTSSTLVINFATPLVGATNTIKIASGALMDENGVPYSLEAEIDNIAVFAYVGASDYHVSLIPGSLGFAFLNFNKPFTINNDSTVTASTYLRNYMSIATDGVNFVPVSNQISNTTKKYIFLKGEFAHDKGYEEKGYIIYCIGINFIKYFWLY